MIDTSKAEPRTPTKAENISATKFKLGYNLRGRSFTVMLSYFQIVLAILAGYIIITYSSKSGKDAWGGFFAIVPLFLIALSSPVMVIAAVYYFVKNRDGVLADKISIIVATLMSIVALYIVGR